MQPVVHTIFDHVCSRGASTRPRRAGDRRVWLCMTVTLYVGLIGSVSTRNPPTLTEGEHMQRKTFGKTMQSLMAVGTLLSALAMFACGGDNDTKDVNVTVDVTNTTVAAVEAVPLTIPNGQVFTPALTGAVTLTFNTINTFTLVGSAGSAATGSVTYTPPACEFVVRDAGSLISTPAILIVPACHLLVNARNVEVGGDPVSGTVTLSLSGASGTVNSNPVTAQVLLDVDGLLFVNNPVTGATVSMGVRP
jgi:hypothetical protein